MADAGGGGARGRRILRARTRRTAPGRDSSQSAPSTTGPTFTSLQGFNAQSGFATTPTAATTSSQPSSFTSSSSSFSFSAPIANNPFASQKAPEQIQPLNNAFSQPPALSSGIGSGSPSPFTFSMPQTQSTSALPSSTPISFNFGASTASTPPIVFGQPQQPSSAPFVFGASSGNTTSSASTTSNPFATALKSNASTSVLSPFAKSPPKPSAPTLFGSDIKDNVPSPFSKSPPKSSTPNLFGTAPGNAISSPFLMSSPKPSTPTLFGSAAGDTSSPFVKSTPKLFNKFPSDTTSSPFVKPASKPSVPSSFDKSPSDNRYLELKPLREKERAEAICKGLIPDPNVPRRLDEAVTFIGTCQDMCPEFEREEREYQNNLESWEVIPGTKRVDHAKAVKAFHRPAAGNEQALPSDVRPPSVLKQALDYLINMILPQDPTMEESHGFVRDRTRSIRQDFTLQNNRSYEAVECHERIARYHILTLHQLCQNASFSEQQETEQLRKVLQSLTEFYDDLRREGFKCPNEAEFRAYYFISHLRDQDILRQAELLPSEIFESSWIQKALEFHALSERNNEQPGRNKPHNHEASLNFFTKFFKRVASPDVPYLMACMLEWHFVDIRKGALKSLRKAYLANHKSFPISKLTVMLGFDDELEASLNCEYYGLEVEYTAVDGEGEGSMMVENGKAKGFPISVALNKSASWEEPSRALKQTKSLKLVEAKRDSMSLSDVINGQYESRREVGSEKVSSLKPTFTFGAGSRTNLTPSLTTTKSSTTSLFGNASANSTSTSSFMFPKISTNVTAPSPFTFGKEEIKKDSVQFFEREKVPTLKTSAPPLVPKAPSPPPPPKPKYNSAQVATASRNFIRNVVSELIKSIVTDARIKELDRRARERKRKLEEEARQKKKKREELIKRASVDVLNGMFKAVVKEVTMPEFADVKEIRFIVRKAWKRWRKLHGEFLTAELEYNNYQKHVHDTMRSLGFGPSQKDVKLTHERFLADDNEMLHVIDEALMEREEKSFGRLMSSLLGRLTELISTRRQKFDIIIQTLTLKEDNFSHWLSSIFGLYDAGPHAMSTIECNEKLTSHVFMSPKIILASNTIGIYIYQVHDVNEGQYLQDLKRLKTVLDVIEEVNKVYIGVLLVACCHSPMEEYMSMLAKFIEDYRTVGQVSTVILNPGASRKEEWEWILDRSIKDMLEGLDLNEISPTSKVEIMALPLFEAFEKAARSIFRLLDGSRDISYVSGFEAIIRLLAAMNHGLTIGLDLDEPPMVMPLPDGLFGTDEQKLNAKEAIASYFAILDDANQNESAINMLRMDIYSLLSFDLPPPLEEIAGRCIRVMVDKANSQEIFNADVERIKMLSEQFSEWAREYVGTWRKEYLESVTTFGDSSIRKRGNEEPILKNKRRAIGNKLGKPDKLERLELETNLNGVYIPNGIISPKLNKLEELTNLMKNVRKELNL